MHFLNFQDIGYGDGNLNCQDMQLFGLYLDVVALVAGFEDDSLELFDPHFCAGCRVCAEVVDSVDGDEFELFLLWISVVHFGVQGVPKVDSPAGEI
jgi:hypothetical protein